MTHPVILIALVFAVAMIVLWGVFFWLRSRQSDLAERGADAWILRYSGAWKALAVAFLAALPVGVALMMSVQPPGPDEVWIARLALALIVGLPLLLAVEVFGVSHRLSEAGVECRSPWSRRRSAGWQEIEALDFSPGMQWFVLRASGGVTVRLSAYLSGLGTFAELVAAHVPAGRVQPQARLMLDKLRAPARSG